MKRRESFLVVVLVIMVIISVSLSIIISFQISSMENLPKVYPPAGQQTPAIERINISSEILSFEGYTKVEIDAVPGVVVLTANCTRMTMETLDFQAYSIKTGLTKVIEERPTIHDVMKDMIYTFGGDILAAKIVRFDGTAYYADLYVKMGNKTVALDSKPSDAIALAVRADAPVYINTEMLEKNGSKIC